METEADMWASRLASVLRKGVEPVSWWGSALGAMALIATMLLIVLEVALRTTMKLVLPGTIEVVQVLLVIIFFAGMAYCEIQKKHIRVDILVNRFSPTARLATTSCADLVTLGIVSIVSWQSVVQAEWTRSSGYVSGWLKIPLWPVGILIAFFMALLAVGVLIDFLESLGELVRGGNNNFLWLAPGIIVILILFGMSFWPNLLLPIKIGPQTFGILAVLLMFALIFLNVHIGAAMAVVTLWGMGYLISPGSGLSQLGITTYRTASSYVWSVLPLFMFMGFQVAATGLSRDLYSTAYKWLGHTRGGLASATVGACGAFAAVVGDTLTGAITMSSIALPQMKAYNYDDKLATASIAAGGTIGALIPPSLGFIVYGILTEQSLGRLFIAGVVPGILLVGLLILLIYVRCRVNPRLGPPGATTPLKEKVISLKDSWAVLLLFLLVIGGIYLGVFTATEAGAIGAFGALVIGLGLRRLTVKAFFNSAMEAAKMASMIFFIFIFAVAVTQFFAVTKVPFALADVIAGLTMSRYAVLALVLLMYLILGCLMNALPVIILTLPIIFPTIIAVGFDPIWFGVLVIVMAEIATITPPIGINVFAMAGVSGVPMYSIFRGVFPFWLVMLGLVAILAIFPQIALFLPNLMMGR